MASVEARAGSTRARCRAASRSTYAVTARRAGTRSSAPIATAASRMIPTSASAIRPRTRTVTAVPHRGPRAPSRPRGRDRSPAPIPECSTGRPPAARTSRRRGRAAPRRRPDTRQRRPRPHAERHAARAPSAAAPTSRAVPEEPPASPARTHRQPPAARRQPAESGWSEDHPPHVAGTRARGGEQAGCRTRRHTPTRKAAPIRSTACSTAIAAARVEHEVGGVDRRGRLPAASEPETASLAPGVTARASITVGSVMMPVAIATRTTTSAAQREQADVAPPGRSATLPAAASVSSDGHRTPRPGAARARARAGRVHETAVAHNTVRSAQAAYRAS